MREREQNAATARQFYAHLTSLVEGVKCRGQTYVFQCSLLVLFVSLSLDALEVASTFPHDAVGLIIFLPLGNLPPFRPPARRPSTPPLLRGSEARRNFWHRTSVEMSELSFVREWEEVRE